MKSITVKDLMLPLAEYAIVPVEATLGDAILALEKAQKEFDPTRHRHRAILVLDTDKKVVGKISMLDVLKGLEPKYGKIELVGMLSRSGFNPDFLQSMVDQYALWAEPFKDICGKAAKLKVRHFMYTPSEGEYVDEAATLSQAVHQLVMGHHHSLLVTRGDDIVGILRLSDVFKEICEEIKACELRQKISADG
jgi:CBS domain-containing protein